MVAWRTDYGGITNCDYDCYKCPFQNESTGECSATSEKYQAYLLKKKLAKVLKIKSNNYKKNSK